jgi:hypothetical protein
VPAHLATDNESAADQMLPGALEFTELVAVRSAISLSRNPTALASISTATTVGLLG